MLDPLIEQIAMGGQAKALAERENQVGTRQARGRADVFQAQGGGAMGADESRCRVQARMALGQGASRRLQIPRQRGEEGRQRGFALRAWMIEQPGKDLQQVAVQLR
ncbi:hypothetical protein D9M71_786490 [compost metagenome]